MSRQCHSDRAGRGDRAYNNGLEPLFHFTPPLVLLSPRERSLAERPF
jgi:hypothetical protein